MSDTRALTRRDDGAIVISTTAYVNHQKRKGAWVSAFSMRPDQAAKLRDELDVILSANLPADGAQPS